MRIAHSAGAPALHHELEMESVLMVGRIRPSRRRRAEDLLNAGLLQRLPRGLTRHSVYRQGDTVALLFDGPAAGREFLELLESDRGDLPALIDCLESVPLLPRELRRVDRPGAYREPYRATGWRPRPNATDARRYGSERDS